MKKEKKSQRAAQKKKISHPSAILREFENCRLRKFNWFANWFSRYGGSCFIFFLLHLFPPLPFSPFTLKVTPFFSFFSSISYISQNMQDPRLTEALAHIKSQEDRIEYLEDMVESLLCTVKVCVGGGGNSHLKSFLALNYVKWAVCAIMWDKKRAKERKREEKKKRSRWEEIR